MTNPNPNANTQADRTESGQEDRASRASTAERGAERFGAVVVVDAMRLGDFCTVVQEVIDALVPDDVQQAKSVVEARSEATCLRTLAVTALVAASPSKGAGA